MCSAYYAVYVTRHRAAAYTSRITNNHRVGRKPWRAARYANDAGGAARRSAVYIHVYTLYTHVRGEGTERFRSVPRSTRPYRACLPPVTSVAATASCAERSFFHFLFFVFFSFLLILSPPPHAHVRNGFRAPTGGRRDARVRTYTRRGPSFRFRLAISRPDAIVWVRVREHLRGGPEKPCDDRRENRSREKTTARAIDRADADGRGVIANAAAPSDEMNARTKNRAPATNTRRRYE